jgi:hypothetical protein
VPWFVLGVAIGTVYRVRELMFAVRDLAEAQQRAHVHLPQQHTSPARQLTTTSTLQGLG